MMVSLLSFPLSVSHDHRPSFSSLPLSHTLLVHRDVTVVEVPPCCSLVWAGIADVLTSDLLCLQESYPGIRDALWSEFRNADLVHSLFQSIFVSVKPKIPVPSLAIVAQIVSILSLFPPVRIPLTF